MGRFFRLLPLCCLAVAMLLSAGTVRAQDGESRLPGMADELGWQTGDADTGDAAEGSEVLFPDLPENFVLNDATLETIQTAVQGYFTYRTRQYEHRLNIFRWQHISSQIIFGVVVAIVAAGLYFSWMQFRASDGGKDMGPMTLEASQSGFKVTASVLGVIILALSLAFFYLYLIYVYPVTESF